MLRLSPWAEKASYTPRPTSLWCPAGCPTRNTRLNCVRSRRRTDAKETIMKTLSTILIFASCALASQSDRAGLKPGTLAEPWLTGGPNCLTVPDWQGHEYNEDFYILRESGCVHFEKPFLYLIFCQNKALLEDTRRSSAQ